MEAPIFEVAALLADVFGGSCDDECEPAPPSLSLLAYQFKLLATLQLRAATHGQQFITLLAFEGPELAGTATVLPGLGPTGAEGHFQLGAHSTAGCICNMAVGARYRRRGLGRALLCAAERATQDWPQRPSLLLLAVERSNEAAVRLYCGAGYVRDEGWVDPQWLENAEKGRVACSRRDVYAKQMDIET